MWPVSSLWELARVSSLAQPPPWAHVSKVIFRLWGYVHVCVCMHAHACVHVGACVRARVSFKAPTL